MKKIKIPRPSIVATFAPETANGDERTVDLTFYSGATVPRFSWDRGEYMLTLSTEKAAVRLGTLNSKTAPVLETHSDWSTKDVLGVIERAWLEGGTAKATARFLTNDEDADRIWNKIEQKIVRNVSMGVRIHKMKETTEKEDKVKSYLATDWEPFEVSVVPIGADPEAHIQMSASSGEQEVEIEEFAVRATSPQETAMEETKTIPASGQGAPAVENTQPAVAVADAQLNAARDVGVTAEQGRITGILEVAKVCHLELSFAEKHIKANTSLDAFRKVAIDEQALRAARQEIRHVHTDILHDEADKRRRNMTGALLERFSPKGWYWDDHDGFRFDPERKQRIFDGSREYASCTLLDIAKECLAVQGIRWQNKSRTEIAQLAFQSTSDFPFILADVAGKSLRAGYEAVPSQWRLIAARRSASDFKDQKELTLDGNSRLLKVPESGEFTRGKLVEGKETWKLSTYGRVISITRQAIINDDLGAFTRTPQLMGQEVAELEADTVYGIITANGNLRDGVALFTAATTRGSTSDGNYISSGTAISIDNIGVLRVLMMRQTSTGGKSLGIQPRYLLAPASKAQLAEQYTSSAYQAATAATINPMAGKLTPIVEARLDASSTTAWYLFADPNSPNGTVLIYAYLEGQEGPYTETRNGFDVDGTEVKVRHDFAAAAVDFRGAVMNAGA